MLATGYVFKEFTFHSSDVHYNIRKDKVSYSLGFNLSDLSISYVIKLRKGQLPYTIINIYKYQLCDSSQFYNYSQSIYVPTVEWIAIGEFSAILFTSGVATSAPNPEWGAIK